MLCVHPRYLVILELHEAPLQPYVQHSILIVGQSDTPLSPQTEKGAPVVSRRDSSFLCWFSYKNNTVSTYIDTSVDHLKSLNYPCA